MEDIGGLFITGLDTIIFSLICVFLLEEITQITACRVGRTTIVQSCYSVDEKDDGSDPAEIKRGSFSLKLSFADRLLVKAFCFVLQVSRLSQCIHISLINKMLSPNVIVFSLLLLKVRILTRF